MEVSIDKLASRLLSLSRNNLGFLQGEESWEKGLYQEGARLFRQRTRRSRSDSLGFVVFTLISLATVLWVAIATEELLPMYVVFHGP